MKTRIYNIEERLIDFAVQILEIVENLPKTYVAQHQGSQLARSGTSPAFNYGEAQSAESTKDFVHKMKICLKELRESQICMKIIAKKSYLDNQKLETVIKENGELIAIFTSRIKTAMQNKTWHFYILHFVVLHFTLNK